MTPLGSGPLLAEVCNLFTIFTLVQRENGDHTHPRTDGKLTISTGSMVFINHILPLTETHRKEGKWGTTLTLARRGSGPLLPEVWYLLTKFSLLRKHIVRRGNGGPHSPLY